MGDTAAAASRSRDGASVTTGRYPACRRPPTRRSPASMRAGWSFSRSMRMARASARSSWCICRMSRGTVRPCRSMWTKLFWRAASRGPKTSAISCRAARICSASLCGAQPRSAVSLLHPGSCAPSGPSIWRIW